MPTYERLRPAIEPQTTGRHVPKMAVFYHSRHRDAHPLLRIEVRDSENKYDSPNVFQIRLLVGYWTSLRSHWRISQIDKKTGGLTELSDGDSIEEGAYEIGNRAKPCKQLPCGYERNAILILTGFALPTNFTAWEGTMLPKEYVNLNIGTHQYKLANISKDTVHSRGSACPFTKNKDPHVQLAHLCPRALSAQVLCKKMGIPEKCQYKIDPTTHKLNVILVDRPDNVIPLAVDIHQELDSGRMILLPARDTANNLTLQLWVVRTEGNSDLWKYHRRMMEIPAGIERWYLYLNLVWSVGMMTKGFGPTKEHMGEESWLNPNMTHGTRQSELNSISGLRNGIQYKLKQQTGLRTGDDSGATGRKRKRSNGNYNTQYKEALSSPDTPLTSEQSDDAC